MKDKINFESLNKVSGGADEGKTFIDIKKVTTTIDNRKTIIFQNSGNTYTVTVSDETLDAYMNGDPKAIKKVEALLSVMKGGK